MTNADLVALANELDDIETDAAGKCNWSEVATVSDALRRLASSEGWVKGEPEPVAWLVVGSHSFTRLRSVADEWQRNGVLLQEVYTAPPADAGMREALEEIEALCCHLRQGGPDLMDLQELSDALEEATNLASAALTAPGAMTKFERTQRRLVASDDCLGPLDAIPRGPSDPIPHTIKMPEYRYQEIDTRGGSVSHSESQPSDPSSTRSEVTARELADFIGTLDPDSDAVARALLDRFEIRRRP